MLYFTIFFLIGAIFSFSAPCPDGWRQSDVIANKCYLIVTNKKNWFDADKYCQSATANGHLTSITSAFEQANINAIVSETQSSSVCDSMWIGANDIEQIGVFTWMDGTPFSYARWEPGQPNLSPNKLCVASQARSSGLWGTNDCGDEFCFICANTSPHTVPYTGTTTPYVPQSTTSVIKTSTTQVPYLGTCNETSSSVLGGSPDATRRDLSVVILNRISMASYQSEWRYGFENFTGWYDANQPNYFDNYYITTFIAKANSSGFVYNIINKLPFTTSAAFRSQIRGLGLTVSTVTTGQPVLSAIQKTIVDNSGNIAIKKRSPMFVFVDDEPSDVYLLRDLELLVVQSQVQLFIMVTSQYASQTTCGIAASGTGQVVYSQLAAISGGLFVNFCNSPPNSPITKTMSALGPILYQLETMTQLDAPDCSTGITDSFGIGNQQTYYIITTSDNTPNVSLYNLDSKQTTVPTAGLHIGNFYLFSLNELPLGTYSITMVSAGQCHFKVAGSSSISAFYGFATPGFDITTTYAQLGSELHPVVHLSGVTTAPEMTVQIYGQYNAQIGGGSTFYLGSSVYRGNSNCSYELYFPGRWECIAPYQYFYIKFLVSDASKTQRTMTGYCMGLQPEECVNGGAFNPVIAGCQCHAAWTGTFCQTPLCFNGGTLVPQDQSCSCAQGYTGLHCEYVSCPVKNNSVAVESAQFEYKSVAFVIDKTLNAAGIDQFVADNIGQFLQATASIEKQYTLVTFDENSVYDIITTSDVKLFQNVTENTLRPSYLRQEAHKLNLNQLDIVPDGLSFEGLLQALELINVQPAIVYVFATGLPYVNFSDSNSAQTYKRIFTLLENQQIQVNFIIGGFHADILTGPAAEDMQKVATFTSGRTIYTGNFFGAPGQFANLIAQYLPLTVQENGFLVEHIVADCTTATVAYIPIDSKSDWFSLIIIGSQMTVTLYDADGNLYQQNASEVITNDKEAAMILRIFNSNKPSFVGFWRVSITTKSGGCTLQARVASSIQVNYGFSLSISADMTTPQPFSGSNVSNVVLANLPQSLQQTNFQLSYFEVLSYNFSSGHGDAQAVLRFKPRDTSCAYQYYSEPFSCPSSAFAVKITGQDADGMPFQRIAALYCIPPN
uniref:Uncharacterized protein n=1 Tax=Plectus sambesii TaxID=2011161 RepID=A0A914VVL6_9BILA